MRTAARMATTGAGAIALAALLASSAFAESRPRQAPQRGHGSSGARDSRGSGQAAPRASQGNPGDRGQRSPAATGQRPESRERADRGRGVPDLSPRTSTPRVGPPASPRTVPQPEPRWQNPPRDPRGDLDRRDGRTGPREGTPRGVPNNRYPGWHPDPRHDSRHDGGRGRPDSRYDSRHDARGWPGGRYGDRDRDPWRDRDHWRDGHRRMHFEGRVQRLERGHGGYRFWLDNCRDPFWIPDARFLLWPLRIGLSVNFGGYWDPAGYYGVYDTAPVGGPYYATTFVEGLVAGYDFRTGVLTVRDDRSGSYVDVVLLGRDLDPRILRTGDWISLSGGWNRAGYFEAFRVEALRER